ncbi:MULTISPECIES: HNH endonuclease [Streptomyces]|uniref:HNH endonuclease n=1 Tax=Streptomyces TaxID=1883 RepID=UPI001A94A753|nr:MULTISPECIES: HNH endonuclease [Streptomyces]MBO0917528.1 HNH endonuclease [Streptomyces laculatispora]
MSGRSDLTAYAYRKGRAAFLADNDVCHICGHVGADVIDHIRPVASGADPRDRDNWAPAHGVNRCPTCGRNCNGEKGANTQVKGLTTSRDWYRPS